MKCTYTDKWIHVEFRPYVSEARPTRKADILTAIFEPIV
jgi:hypothetical protein